MLKFSISELLSQGRSCGLVDSIATLEPGGPGSIPCPAKLFFLFYEKIQIFMRKTEIRAVFQISLNLKRSSIQEIISNFNFFPLLQQATKKSTQTKLLMLLVCLIEKSLILVRTHYAPETFKM